MGGKKPLRRPLWPPTRATASNYYPLGLDGAGGAAKPLLRAPKKPAPLRGRLPAFSGAVDAFERARKCFLEWRYFFSIILSEFLKNRVALQQGNSFAQYTLGKLYLLGQEVQVDREEALRYFAQAAAQGNTYAQYFIDQQDDFSGAAAGTAILRMLHQMSRIFRENAAQPAIYAGMQIDKKRRRRLQEKRMAMGHKADDHEDRGLTQQTQ